ncbi:MAG: EutN/CcmL family microcompartment protein [Candidatus Wallbacteria bacterium]|nr:EutN/CcmL family microcompartment protein [Candidatus Wallbacteria bacterium]
MILGKICGTIVATKKDENLVGFKFLIVEELTVERKPAGKFYITVDTVGAGAGEVVLVVTGSSARQTAKTDKKPVDAAVVAIVDTISLTKAK